MSPRSDPAQAADRSYAEYWAAEFFLGEAAEERGPVAYTGYQNYTPFQEEQEPREAYGPQAEREDRSAGLEYEGSHEALNEDASAHDTHSHLPGPADHEQHIGLAGSEEGHEERYPAAGMFEQAFFEPEGTELFADEEEEEESGAADEVLSGLDRAVRLNRRYGEELGWRVRYDAVARYLGFVDFSPDEKTFAEAVARWQRGQGLKGDGIIGP